MEFPETVDGVDLYWLGHASLKLVDSDSFTVYVDPWNEVMQEASEYPSADVVISTHDHHDHFDVKAIQAVKKDDTVVICAEESADDVPEDVSYKALAPDRTAKAHKLRVHGVPAHNVDKFRSPDVPYHPAGFGFGAVFALDGVTFYHAGDTDPIPAMDRLAERDIDVAFLPVGGTYTMDQDEAVKAATRIQPDRVVPIHYGTVEETTADVERFADDIREETAADPLVLERQVP